MLPPKETLELANLELPISLVEVGYLTVRLLRGAVRQLCVRVAAHVLETLFAGALRIPKKLGTRRRRKRSTSFSRFQTLFESVSIPERK